MEILFCDLCNESVPESDLTLGTAVRRGERVICASCEAAMSASLAAAKGSSEAPAAAVVANASTAPGTLAAPASGHHAAPVGARRGGGGWLALVALLFSAGACAWLARELEAGDEEARSADAELASDVRALEGSGRELLSAFDRRTSELSREVRDGLERVRGELAQELSGLRTDQAAALERLIAAEAELAALRREAQAETLTLGERLDEITIQILRAREDANFHGERLAAVEQAVQSGRGLVAAPPTPGEPGVAPVDPDAAPAWQALVADLTNANAGIRWNAVDALGETGDAAVVPYLVPVLKDEDLFVRMAVARVLGDLASPLGIAPLIDALEDEETVVRETAMLSLRTITNRDFKFDAVASPAERSKKVKAWRKWWEKAEGEYFPDSQP